MEFYRLESSWLPIYATCISRSTIHFAKTVSQVYRTTWSSLKSWLCQWNTGFLGFWSNSRATGSFQFCLFPQNYCVFVIELNSWVLLFGFGHVPRVHRDPSSNSCWIAQLSQDRNYHLHLEVLPSKITNPSLASFFHFSTPAFSDYSFWPVFIISMWFISLIVSKLAGFGQKYHLLESNMLISMALLILSRSFSNLICPRMEVDIHFISFGDNICRPIPLILGLSSFLWCCNSYLCLFLDLEHVLIHLVRLHCSVVNPSLPVVSSWTQVSQSMAAHVASFSMGLWILGHLVIWCLWKQAHIVLPASSGSIFLMWCVMEFAYSIFSGKVYLRWMRSEFTAVLIDACFAGMNFAVRETSWTSTSTDWKSPDEFEWAIDLNWSTSTLESMFHSQRYRHPLCLSFFVNALDGQTHSHGFRYWEMSSDCLAEVSSQFHLWCWE